MTIVSPPEAVEASELFDPRGRALLLDRIQLDPDFLGVNIDLIEDGNYLDDLRDEQLLRAYRRPFEGLAADLGTFLVHGEVSPALDTVFERMDEIRGSYRWFTYMTAEGKHKYGQFLFSAAAQSDELIGPTRILDRAEQRGIGSGMKGFSQFDMRPSQILIDMDLGHRLKRQPDFTDIVYQAKYIFEQTGVPVTESALTAGLKSNGFYSNKNSLFEVVKDTCGGFKELNLLIGAVSFLSGEEGSESLADIEAWLEEVIQQNGFTSRVITAEVLQYLHDNGLGITKDSLVHHGNKGLKQFRADIDSRIEAGSLGRSSRYEHIDFRLPPELAIKYPSEEALIQWGVEVMHQNGGNSAVLTKRTINGFKAQGIGPSFSQINPTERSKPHVFDSLGEFIDRVERSFDRAYGPDTRDRQLKRAESLLDGYIAGEVNDRILDIDVAQGDVAATLNRRNAMYQVAIDITGGDRQVSADALECTTIAALAQYLSEAVGSQVNEADISQSAAQHGLFVDLFVDLRERRFKEFNLALDTSGENSPKKVNSSFGKKLRDGQSHAHMYRGELVDDGKIYLNNGHKILSREAERRIGRLIELGRLAEQSVKDGVADPGDRLLVDVGVHAQHILAGMNMRWARSYVYRSSSFLISDREKEDLLADAFAGVLEAAARFDWRKGSKFSVYSSSWMRKSLHDGNRTSKYPNLSRAQYEELRQGTQMPVAGLEDSTDSGILGKDLLHSRNVSIDRLPGLDEIKNGADYSYIDTVEVASTGSLARSEKLAHENLLVMDTLNRALPDPAQRFAFINNRGIFGPQLGVHRVALRLGLRDDDVRELVADAEEKLRGVLNDI